MEPRKKVKTDKATQEGQEEVDVDAELGGDDQDEE